MKKESVTLALSISIGMHILIIISLMIATEPEIITEGITKLITLFRQ